nr:hypothetical protein CFP56_02169 [Quercus suber]
MGHQKNLCPYTIRHELSGETTERTTKGSVPSSPCETHAPDNAKKGQGNNESVNGCEKEEIAKGTYGPWIVVASKRNGTRQQVTGGSTMRQVRDQPWHGSVTNGKGSTNDMGNTQASHYAGIGKDVKRKISANTDLDGPMLASSLQGLGKTPNSWAQKDATKSPANVGVEKHLGQTGLGKDEQILKPNRSEPILNGSVKRKKALTRARAITVNSPSAIRVAKGKILSLNQYKQDRAAQNCDGNQGLGVPTEFHFKETPCSEVAVQPAGRDRRSETELKQGLPGLEVVITKSNGIESMQKQPIGVLSQVEDVGTSTELHEPLGGQTHGGDCTKLASGCTGQSSGDFAGDGIGGDAKITEADRMDFEGDGETMAGF